jgi:spermidine/putrescine transport system substrate-binding protein
MKSSLTSGHKSPLEFVSLLGWSGYEPTLNKVFEEFTTATGFGVKFLGCRNQDDMLSAAKNVRHTGQHFDVACPTTDRLVSWDQAELLQAWDEKAINFDQIADAFSGDELTLRSDRRLGSPNLWGSAALGYLPDADKVDPGNASLMDMFDDRYAGKLILREDTAFVAAGRALDAMGQLPFDFSDSYRDESCMVENYDAILVFLRKKRKNVSRFWFSEYEAQSAFREGACVIGYVWDTTVAALQEEGIPIRFSATKEGAACYIQNFVLLKGAPQLTAANAWVSWVNTPRGGASYAQAFRAFSPAKGALELMDERQRQFHAQTYPPSAMENLWWQPEQKPWFVKHREAYARAFLAP